MAISYFLPALILASAALPALILASAAPHVFTDDDLVHSNDDPLSLMRVHLHDNDMQDSEQDQSAGLVRSKPKYGLEDDNTTEDDPRRTSVVMKSSGEIEVQAGISRHSVGSASMLTSISSDGAVEMVTEPPFVALESFENAADDDKIESPQIVSYSRTGTTSDSLAELAENGASIAHSNQNPAPSPAGPAAGAAGPGPAAGAAGPAPAPGAVAPLPGTPPAAPSPAPGAVAPLPGTPPAALSPAPGAVAPLPGTPPAAPSPAPGAGAPPAVPGPAPNARMDAAVSGSQSRMAAAPNPAPNATGIHASTVPICRCPELVPGTTCQYLDSDGAWVCASEDSFFTSLLFFCLIVALVSFFVGFLCFSFLGKRHPAWQHAEGHDDAHEKHSREYRHMNTHQHRHSTSTDDQIAGHKATDGKLAGRRSMFQSDESGRGHERRTTNFTKHFGLAGHNSMRKNNSVSSKAKSDADKTSSDSDSQDKSPTSSKTPASNPEHSPEK